MLFSYLNVPSVKTGALESDSLDGLTCEWAKFIPDKLTTSDVLNGLNSCSRLATGVEVVVQWIVQVYASHVALCNRRGSDEVEGLYIVTSHHSGRPHFGIIWQRNVIGGNGFWPFFSN